ncbi:hypothetical protein FHX42_004663 [Saccharopolyspora lacisalsi]|uniref:Uncharacterized protein n=1 Tax=Halosaccharopolyspora lacisalsi TaxID=1000566 RepID=A0A839E343_9PSEU|nr:hypothetical protein [Halosaccharopolyspora lacisalsi]MBA8827279.1 hypothetical protein [Halosaccharopolyspora lacisalsi]
MQHDPTAGVRVAAAPVAGVAPGPGHGDGSGLLMSVLCDRQLVHGHHTGEHRDEQEDLGD